MASLRTGTVVKAQTNLYEVRLDGEEQVILCALRGRLRRQAGDVLTGDRVEVALQDGGAAIERVLPRRNRLVRPPIANVDRVLLVQSLQEPDPVPILMDRVIVQAEAMDLPVVIAFTKLDRVARAPEDPLPGWAARLVEGYRLAGYPVHLLAAPRGWGVEGLAAALREGVTVVAGPSGAGKSTLLNALQPGLNLATGEVSRKLGRGRHTTRFVELLPLAGGGWVADTPGFSKVELPELEPEELGDLWPEIRRAAPGCRFRGCLHRSEPGCAVRTARDQGQIASWRYQNYLVLLSEVEERLAERYR
ncbi:ribosome small subunit-dependent GTPase A [Thermaerobacter sp. PB12/4term]|uniref:ribosome small subunit-dependent GTPase A n=1 Tax=Thermaerobacter sp. PB12/4term TaxID=2293838 RepID=UPI000E32594C|nr:ribosome small subunit-dependent GTPase A [Thermaerobacter sp. PB12/4term]QIA26894.1 ribosome small subunit-dependent GTPase A [Thermaerobacter sp. PB12/4term]